MKGCVKMHIHSHLWKCHTMNLAQHTAHTPLGNNWGWNYIFLWTKQPFICLFMLLFRHQGPAADHECCLWHWPRQGDQLHGACSDSRLPTHQIQRWLGCQAYLDPPLLHAVLGGWRRAKAGASSSFKECVTHDDFEEMYSKSQAF